MLESAFLVTYWFRFHAGIWPVPLGIPPLDVYLVASAVILVVFFFIFYASGLYGRPPGGSLEQDLTDLFKGVVLGSLLVLAIAFFFRQMTFSRSFFGLFFLSCFFFLTLGRILVRLILGRILRRGLGLTRVLLVGSNPMRARLVRSCRELPGLNLELVGWLRASEDEDPVAAAAETEGLPCLGGVEDVRETVRERGIDLVVLTLPFDQLALVRDIAAQLGNLNADLKFAPDLMALHTSRMRLTEIAGIPFISVREVALSGADRIVKRTFDLVAATAGLLVISPLLLLISLLVKLSSPGPVFFRQERIGRDGRAFTMIKFRTMRPDAEERSGPVWTVEGDPRVTTLGRVLRRLSLDELPQLWNVVRGDMSLVGPRPERRVFVDEFSQRMPRYFERHRVRSGLTGWAQVHGLRGNTSIEERTLYDLHYVENWSLALDVKIILMTINHVLWGENAY
jgi:exopolysaccharide biosynthesis polyprenyl glycosylphosphotransferase